MDSPIDNGADAEKPAEAQGEVPAQPEQSTGSELPNAAEAAPAGEVGTVTVEPPEKPRRSGFQRLLYFLFSPETRVGRFMRPFLRGAALIVGVFALGMLAAYLLVFAPADRQLKATQSQLAGVQQQLDDSQAALATAQAGTGELNTQVTGLTARVDAGKTRVHLLLVTAAAKDAQLALVNKDGPTAQKALESAKQELSKIQADLQSLNADVAGGLAPRLDLAASELVRDPKTAQSDLAILITNLAQMDELLAKQFD